MARSKRSTASRRRQSGPSGRATVPRFLAARRRRRRVIVLAAVAALAVTVLVDRAGLLIHQGDERSRYDGQAFEVVRIIAGDTLEVNAPDGDSPTTRVRLWGVRTPAPARPEHGRPEPEPGAEEAIAFVREQVAGRPVRLEVESHRLRDDHGQVLAHLHLDGRSLNAQLLRAGLARTDTRWSHEHLERYADYQAEARAAGRGMWADE